MDNQSYQYLKEKVSKAEKLQQALKEIECFIDGLNDCNDKYSMVVSIKRPGCAETKLGDYHNNVKSDAVCKYFYPVLLDTALKLKEQLEQEYKEL